MSDGLIAAAPELLGRRVIYTSVEQVNADNVIDVVNNALSFHVKNLQEEEYLYWYRRGLQPILSRTKEVRPEINNTVVENHADEIVNFKNGYFLTQPAFYVARNEASQDKIDELNEYLYRSGKQQVDNRLADWFHTVGRAALLIRSNDDKNVPVKAYALDPRSAFVVYSLEPGNEPIMGVNMVISDEKLKVDAFTKDAVYRLSGGFTGKVMTSMPERYVATVTNLDKSETNPLGKVPIIEYSYNSVGMSSFENVIPLLDSINNVMSNRVDGIEQFIQSLAVAVNCQFDEGTTANDIRQAGMIVLKSIGENKADFKILSEQLNQSETQVLVDYLYDQVLRIAAMPSTTKGGTSTSDTGTAVYLRDGFAQADTCARNTEDLFKESNRRFDEIFIDILKRKGILDVELTDFDLNFVRNSTSNMQSKAQTLHTLLSAGLEPTIALERSGVSNDPISDFKQSEKYFKMVWGDPDNPMAMMGADGMTAAVSSNASGGTSEDGIPSQGASSDSVGRDESKLQGKWSRAARGVVRVEDGKVYSKVSDAERDNGLATGRVTVAANKGGTAGGYHWKFVDQRSRK